MKILLDECVTKHLKPLLNEFEVHTTTEMEWSGIKNGKLMALCVGFGFDVLLTIDKSLQYQQSLEKFAITIVILDSVSSKFEELRDFVPAFKEQVNQFEKHKAYLLTKKI
jgi:hypothetical protein